MIVEVFGGIMSEVVGVGIWDCWGVRFGMDGYRWVIEGEEGVGVDV